MDKKDRFSLWLAVFGTIFVIAPLVAAVVFSLIHLLGAGIFNFDFLAPAELLPLVLIGSGLLIWAAIRARKYRALIIISFAAGIVLLFGGQFAAVASGIASGASEPTGFWWGVTLASIIVFDLSTLVMTVGGILLSLGLFRQSKAQISGGISQ